MTSFWYADIANLYVLKALCKSQKRHKRTFRVKQSPNYSCVAANNVLIWIILFIVHKSKFVCISFLFILKGTKIFFCRQRLKVEIWKQKSIFALFFFFWYVEFAKSNIWLTFCYQLASAYFCDLVNDWRFIPHFFDHFIVKWPKFPTL